MKANQKTVLTTLTALSIVVIFASPVVYAWTVNITTNSTIAGTAPGGTVTVPVIAYNVTSAVPDIATAIYNIEFNASVVNVTNVATGSGNALPVSNWNFIASNIVRILAWDTTAGHTGDVNIANVTFIAKGAEGSTSPLEIGNAQFTDYNISMITPDSTNNGTFTVWDVTPPDVINPTKSRDYILNDNGRARPAGYNESRVNVTVVETGGNVESVSINLSEIGQGIQDMSPLGGDIYSISITNVSAAHYGNNNFKINATDDWSPSPNSNTSVIVNVTVLVRGDVYPAEGNGAVDLQDGFYMQKFLVGEGPQPDMFVGDIYPAEGNGAVDLQDGFYMQKFLVGKEDAP
jgi:hypothetical protein